MVKNRTHEADDYEQTLPVASALCLIRFAHRRGAFGPGSGWSSYKMGLWKLLNPGRPYPGHDWDVPVPFIYAQKRVLAGWSKADAYRQVVVNAHLAKSGT
jgi:hypothetical protein